MNLRGRASSETSRFETAHSGALNPREADRENSHLDVAQDRPAPLQTNLQNPVFLCQTEASVASSRAPGRPGLDAQAMLRDTPRGQWGPASSRPLSQRPPCPEGPRQDKVDGRTPDELPSPTAQLPPSTSVRASPSLWDGAQHSSPFRHSSACLRKTACPPLQVVMLRAPSFGVYFTLSL